MGLLGKALAYRWATGGGGDDGAGGAALAVIFLVFAAFFGVIWATGTILGFIWGVIKSTVQPVLLLFPPVTIPIAMVVLGFLFTLVGPYPSEKATAFLGEDSDKLPFTQRTGWAMVAVNAVLLFPQMNPIPDLGAIDSLVLTVLAAILIGGTVLVLGIYGLYELFHTPYRNTRLLLHAPKGRWYAIGALSPILFVIVSGGFEVPLGIPISLSGSIESEMAAMLGALAVLNVAYLGGAVAVFRNREEIRSNAATTD